jgi:citrate synthase
MSFLQANADTDALQWVKQSLPSIKLAEESELEAGHVVPGFGARFGGLDPFLQRAAQRFSDSPASGKYLAWSNAIVKHLENINVGWLPTGLAAAVLCDLGFPAYAGAGLYQLMIAPGILAHGLEFYPRPRTAWPYVKDENYEIVAQ